MLNNISKPCSLLLLSNNPSNKLFFCFFSLLLFKKLNKPCFLFSSFFISFSTTFFISSLLSPLLFIKIFSSILTLSCFCSSFWLLLLSSKFISISTSSGSTFSLLSSFIWLPSSFWALKTKSILSIFITLSNVGKIFSCISSFWLFSSSFSSALSFIGFSFSFFSSSSFLLFFNTLISSLILNRPLFSISLPNKLDLLFLISRFPGNKGLFLFSSIIGWSEGFVSFNPGNKGDFIGFDFSLLGFSNPNPGNKDEVVVFFCPKFSVLVSGLFVKKFDWFEPKVLLWEVILLFLSLFSSLISSLLLLLFLLSRVLYTFSKLPVLSKILNEFFISFWLLFWFNALIALVLFSCFLSSSLILDITLKNGLVLLFIEFVIFVFIVILLSLLSFLSPIMKFFPKFWFIYAVSGDWYFFSSIFISFVIISFKVGLFSTILLSNKELLWDFISSLPFDKKGEKIFETLLFFKNISSVFLLSKPELKKLILLLLLSNKPSNKLLFLFLFSFCSLLLFWNNFWLKNELLSCPGCSSNKLLLKIISFFTSFLSLLSFFSSFSSVFSSFFSSFISFSSSLLSSFIITLMSSFSLILSPIISSFISPGSISISSWLSWLFCSSIIILFWLFLSFESKTPNLTLFESKEKLFFLGVSIFSLLFGTKPNFTFKLSSFTSLDLSTELLTFESLILILLLIIFVFVFSLFLNPNVTLVDNGI